MLFKSRHAAMVFKVRSAIPRFNAMGEIIATRPAIRAEFGQFGAEQAVHNPLTGSTEMFAEVVGHFFDTDLWHEQRLGESTDPAEIERCLEEKTYLEAVLLRKCREVPEFIERIEKARVPAPKPWASYDGQAAADVVAAASLLALVPEALAYERENGQRADVLGPLEEALTADDADRAEPPTAYEAGAFEVPGQKSGVAVGKPQGRTDFGMVTETMPGSSINLG